MDKLKLIDTSDIPNYHGNLVIYLIKKVLKFMIIVVSIVGVIGLGVDMYRKKKIEKSQKSSLYE
jgi:hypothetical protein